jgi:hypothetical protein
MTSPQRSSGYLPVTDGRVIASGSLTLPVPASRLTPGDQVGPTVADLATLLHALESATGARR